MGAGPAGPPEQWRCARKLWDWHLHYVSANWDAVFGEVNCDRRGCLHFMKWNPGRDPSEHLKMESGAIDFRRNLVLQLAPVLYGTIGAVVGWLLSRGYQN
jgi:hypothetical protein